MNSEEILKQIASRKNDSLNEYLTKKWVTRIEKLLSYGHKPENLIIFDLNELERCYDLSMKMEKEELENKKKLKKELDKNLDKTQYASKIEADEKLYEQIYDYKENKSAFVHYNSVGIVKEEQVNGIFPVEDEILQKGVVLLPSDAVEYESEEKLIDEIKTHIKKYLDVPEDYLTYATYYILLSWVYEKVNTIPYLRALGDTGSGKSRYLKVIGEICYKPIRTSGTVTPAPIYRLQERWKGTMLIEESDRKKSDAADEITKILNCGFEKGNAVLRCDKDSPDTIQVHEVFGPKVITSRYRFYDKALEARCLTNVMRETSRKDIPYLLGNTYESESMAIRNKLLMFRLKNWDSMGGETEAMDIINKYDLSGIEPRLKQVATPFFILLKNEVIAKPFIDFIKEYNNVLIEERGDTDEGQIVNIIFDFNEKGVLISSKDIADVINADLPKGALQFKTQKIGKYLKSLGIETEKARNSEGQMRRFIKLTEELKTELFRRYVSKEKVVSSVSCVSTTMGSAAHDTNLEVLLNKHTKKNIEDLPATNDTHDTVGTKTAENAEKCIVDDLGSIE